MAASLAQLQSLVALADAGTFSGAARRLRVTQPAVTQHVANLGREYGAALVDIVGRRAVFTEAGTYLLERARAIVDAVAALDVDMQEFEAVRAGTLRIGATLTIASYVVPALLAEFTRRRPAMKLEVRVGNTGAIAAMLRSHELGLALVEGVLHEDGIATAPFREDDLVLIAGSGGPFARESEVRAAQLAGVPFISREPGSGTRDLGYEALTRMGVHPAVVLELPNAEGIVRAVECGLGVAILSRLAVEDSAARGTVRIVTVGDLPLKRSFFLAGTRGRTLSPAQRALTQLVLGSTPAAERFESALALRKQF